MFLLVFYWSLLNIIKFWAHEIPTRINLWPTKYPREKILDPRNTHKKKYWTHEIPTRKNLRPTKYPRENILDPPNAHEKNFRTKRRHDATRPTMVRDPRNLAHSAFQIKSSLIWDINQEFLLFCKSLNRQSIHYFMI